MGQPFVSSLRRMGAQINVLVRAREWWGYKFSPLLATAYATTYLTGASLWSLLPCLLILLLALTVGAVYVSLINDWTDRAIDRAAGKANRLADKSTTFVWSVLGLCLAIGLAFGYYFWTIAPAVSLWYSGAWIAYSLYSIPPFRLKTRSFAGVLADAAGAHLFPQLFTIALISHWVGHTVPDGWWWAIGVWSLACGIRNILWHVLSDVVADRQAGINTFVTHVGEVTAQRLGQWVIFPIEVTAFAVLLILLANPAALIALALYVIQEFMRRKLWNVRLYVLAPNQRIVLNEYYITYYPLAILLTQSARYPVDMAVLVLHLLLFGSHLTDSLRNAYHIAGHLRHRLLR